MGISAIAGEESLSSNASLLSSYKALPPEFQQQREVEAIMKDPRIQEIFDRIAKSSGSDEIVTGKRMFHFGQTDEGNNTYIIETNTGKSILALVIYTHDETRLQPKNFIIEYKILDCTACDSKADS